MKKYNILGINETGALILPESTKIYMANEKKKRDSMASACASKSASHWYYLKFLDSESTHVILIEKKRLNDTIVMS